MQVVVVVININYTPKQPDVMIKLEPRDSTFNANAKTESSPPAYK